MGVLEQLWNKIVDGSMVGGMDDIVRKVTHGIPAQLEEGSESYVIPPPMVPLTEERINHIITSPSYLANPIIHLVYKPKFRAFDMITDHLYLTGYFGLTAHNFDKYNVKLQINVTVEVPHVQGLESLRIPAEDNYGTDLSLYFNEVADKIETVAKSESSTVVNCVGGVSRSSALVMGYLMKYKKMTLSQAFDHVWSVRDIIRPNNKFCRQLMAFETQIWGKSLATMVRFPWNGVTVEVPDFLYRNKRVLEFELSPKKLGMSIRVDPHDSLDPKDWVSVSPPVFD
jgi:protein-tyrosine phosphatase